MSCNVRRCAFPPEKEFKVLELGKNVLDPIQQFVVLWFGKLGWRRPPKLENEKDCGSMNSFSRRRVSSAATRRPQRDPELGLRNVAGTQTQAQRRQQHGQDGGRLHLRAKLMPMQVRGPAPNGR
jgi:hypothetical protein